MSRKRKKWKLLIIMINKQTQQISDIYQYSYTIYYNTKMVR